MAEDIGEKTEHPTARRMQQARDDGNIAKSTDLSGALLLLIAIVGLYVYGSTLIEGIFVLVRRALEPAGLAGNIDMDATVPFAIFGFGQMFRLMLPMLLLVAFAAYVTQVMQVKLNFTLKPLKPNLGKLNPIKGAKNILSAKNFVKLIMNLSKFGVIGSVAMLLSALKFPQVVALPMLTLQGATVKAVELVIQTTIWLLFILVSMGVIDYLYQKWKHTQELKMTKQEVQDERKSSEGDPKIKAQRFRMYQEIVAQQLQSAVPGADVIVTNPTHFAVALKYDSGSMHAPRVVAKGADYIAIRIRLIASSQGVPIVERPPLARALYYGVEVGDEIPVEQFESVAEVLAYVYRLEGRAAS